MRQKTKATVISAHLETGQPAGWSATIRRCAFCDGDGWLEHSDHGEPCPACVGDGLIVNRRRRWWSTAAELLAIGATLALCWAAWTMLP